jgi:hypothetical protein
MKKLRVTVVTMLTASLLAPQGGSARFVEKTIVRVPFRFSVGSQTLPAGTYKLELATQAQPGKDALEIVVLHGREQRAYASFVSRLLSDESQSAGLSFQQAEGREFLIEIRVRGKRLAPAALPQEIVAGKIDAIRELNAEDVTASR